MRSSLDEHHLATLSVASLLVLSLAMLASPQKTDAVSSWPPNNLKIDLYPSEVGQVGVVNGSSYFEVKLRMDVTYHGISPPKWIVITQSNVSSRGPYSLANLPVWEFGNSSWQQIATYTWQPAVFQNGPYELPGQYSAFATGGVNSWPNENITFFFAFAVSTVTMSGQEFAINASSLNVNVGDKYSPDDYYYTVTKAVQLASGPTTLASGEPIGVVVVRWDLSHKATVVAGLSFVRTLESVYPLLIVLFIVLFLIKALGIFLQKLPELPVGDGPAATHPLITVAGRYKSTTLTQITATILLFLPFFEISVKQFVPPWVTSFDQMMNTLFGCFLAMVLVGLILILCDKPE